MGDHKAFFYGTLMAPEVLYRVCYGTTEPEGWQKAMLTVKPAILHHYERHKVRYADYPGIIASRSASSSSSVRGTLVTGLTEGDLWRLDIFEGDEYNRANVDVYPLEVVGDDTGKGNVESSTPVRVQTYVWTAESDRLEDGEWDFGDFVRTKMARWIGGREEYEGESTQLRPSIQANAESDFGSPIIPEVDEAVETLGQRDPTNGRGRSGAITEKLRQDGAQEDILESAV